MANIMRLGGGGGGKPKKLLSSLTEGSLVSVLEDGKLTPFYVAKHNYEADLNGEGRTLLVRKDAYAAMSWHSNSNSNEYSTSDVDNWLNNTYANKLSVVVRSHLVPTSIDYVPGGGGKNVLTLERALFILSLTELGLSDSGVPTTGTALPTASKLKIVYKDGAAVSQWTRNPFTVGNVYYAITVNASGGVESPKVTSNTPYVRPCLTLPDTMALTTQLYDNGSWGLADELEPTATVNITENGIHNVENYSFANVDVASAPVLLWTNPTTNGTYINYWNQSTASIAVADVSDYPAVIFEVYPQNNIGVGVERAGFCIVKTDGTKAAIGGSTDGSFTYCRQVYFSDSTTLKSVMTSSINCAVPYRMWGIKFTL